SSRPEDQGQARRLLRRLRSLRPPGVRVPEGQPPGPPPGRRLRPPRSGPDGVPELPPIPGRQGPDGARHPAGAERPGRDASALNLLSVGAFVDDKAVKNTVAYRIVGQIVDHVYGPDEKVTPEEFLHVYRIFNGAGGSWEGLIGGDMKSVAILEGALERFI